MANDASSSALDRPLARLVAGLVILGVAGALLAIHWGDLFGEESAAALDPSDPVAICMAGERATIEKMVGEGVFSEEQAGRALAGAEARCQAQFGSSGPPPPPQ